MNGNKLNGNKLVKWGVVVAIGAGMFWVYQNIQVTVRDEPPPVPESVISGQVSTVDSKPATPEVRGGDSQKIAAPVASPTPSLPPHDEEYRKMARSTFAEYLDSVYNGLPKQVDVQMNAPKDGHPEALKEAAFELAEVADRVAKTPFLKPEALEFYQKCALDQGGLQSVRALCLNRAWRAYAELHRAEWTYQKDQIPVEIVELAKKL